VVHDQILCFSISGVSCQPEEVVNWYVVNNILFTSQSKPFSVYFWVVFNGSEYLHIRSEEKMVSGIEAVRRGIEMHWGNMIAGQFACRIIDALVERETPEGRL